MSLDSRSERVYVIANIQSGKERELADEVLSRARNHGVRVQMLNFVHGIFDFIIAVSGDRYSIDRVILELRRLPFVRNTDTLIPIEMSNLESDTYAPPVRISTPISSRTEGPTAPKTRSTENLEWEECTTCTCPIVLYSSKDGNTEKVALEIASELNCPVKKITKDSIPSSVELKDFDLVFVGTGIYRSCPNEDLVTFLRSANLDGRKQFVLFMTWWRIGKSDLSAFRVLEKILSTKRKRLLEDYYICLGNRLKGYPSNKEKRQARLWAIKMFKKS